MNDAGELELTEAQELRAIELAGGRVIRVGTMAMFQLNDDRFTQVAMENKFLLYAALASLLNERVAELAGGFQARYSLAVMQGRVAALAHNVTRILCACDILEEAAAARV